jgi:predicted nucleic acid-binding protein
VIVVADTSPLNYLVQIDCDFLLPALYRHVSVPPTVIAELSHSSAPQKVEAWTASLPGWIEVASLKTEPDARLALLDPGERDAIQLALERQATIVLIDEHRGRFEAQSRGLATVGTIGVLIAGQKFGLVDSTHAFERLTGQTTFRHTPQLRQSFLDALRAMNEGLGNVEDDRTP